MINYIAYAVEQRRAYRVVGAKSNARNRIGEIGETIAMEKIKIKRKEKKHT